MDQYDLQRFIDAQEGVIDSVLSELKAGRKRTHWMWFVFPQVAGLGRSEMAKRYSISSGEEARAFLRHPVLGIRLMQCTEALLAIDRRSAFEIFGTPDDLKLKSSMTLFESITEPGSAFAKVLDKYFSGARDGRTLELLRHG